MTTDTSQVRARIGVLVPFTNTNLEPDMARLRPKGYVFHFTRLGGYELDAIPDFEQMSGMGASNVDEPVRLISGVRPDVVMYGCTSATLTHGVAFDWELGETIRQQSGAHCVTAAGALAFALQRLSASRIGFASPYVGAINEQAVSFLSGVGVETVKVAEIGKDLDNYGQGELQPHEIYDLAMQADHPDAEVIVLSCTDMRSVEVIADVERDIGKPVVTSNQAMLYQTMSVLGHDTTASGIGKLFDAHENAISHMHRSSG